MDIEKLKLLHSQGLANRNIGKILGCHHNTVEYHLTKLGLISKWGNEKIKRVDAKTFQCTRCHKILDSSLFQFGRKKSSNPYQFSYCNDCRRKQSYSSLNNDINSFLSDRFNRLKLRCKKFGIKISLQKADFLSQFYAQKGKCFYTDVELVCKVGQGHDKHSLSIDKIIPEKGYVKGNFVFCSTRANTVKHDLSLEEMSKWLPSWYDRAVRFLD